MKQLNSVHKFVPYLRSNFSTIIPCTTLIPEPPADFKFPDWSFVYLSYRECHLCLPTSFAVI